MSDSPLLQLDPNLALRAKPIRLLALDVDGVLTDGKLYFGNDGEELKAFSTLDGQGIKLLQTAGIAVAIFTARSSTLVSNRAANLGIRNVLQGCQNKLAALQTLQTQLAIPMEHTAYVGDDLPDLACIRRVGLGMAVSNAHASVKQHAAGITLAAGGDGAVREVCDLILQAQGRYDSALAPYL
jgi:3-deoxy-D-manno-octulosonate 8-phosphate phosphatase (KDO 8-P phosphatase)